MTTQIQPLAGTVVTLENDAALIHTYSAPEDSFFVNSHVIETEHALVLLDGQLMRGYAAEFAGYVESLGKPVDRLILSHVHPDHFAGLPVLSDRFPGAEIHALAQVKQYLDANAAVMLENRAGALGDALDGRTPVISKVLPVGEEVIDGPTYRFAHLHDAESQHSLLIELPQLGTTIPVDVVFRNEFHLFTVGPYFDPWTEVLVGLRDRLGSAERLLVGHGAPSDPLRDRRQHRLPGRSEGYPRPGRRPRAVRRAAQGRVPRAQPGRVGRLLQPDALRPAEPLGHLLDEERQRTEEEHDADQGAGRRGAGRAV